MVRLQRAVEMSRFGNWKKLRYLTDNHITVIITIYRECYDIKRNVGILYIFFNLEFCFKLRLFSRDNSWFWYRREL